jgi:flagellar hook assembly protein FlgD
MAAGFHTVTWDGADDGAHRVPAGVYLARLVTPTRTYVERLIRLD